MVGSKKSSVHVWFLKQRVLEGSSVNWVAKDGSILFHFNARPDQKIIYLNSCPKNLGWNPTPRIISYDGKSLIEAKVTADANGFKIVYNGVEQFYEARLPWNTFEKIEIQ